MATPSSNGALTPSDNNSFYTAPSSHNTQNNSSASSTAFSSPPNHQLSSSYRDVRHLPRDLKQHCHIFLEEQLYTCAINLLNSILATGISSKNHNHKKPVPAPPTSHLAFLSTIAVHPSYTTRASKSEQVDVASLALGYLRSLLFIVGPLNADFKTAFQFQEKEHGHGRRSKYAAGNSSDLSDADHDPDDDRLSGKLANQSSLWARGQNFWAVVGWAMNCSALYPPRWRYWYTWLAFMVELLETDWAERERLDMDAPKVADGSSQDSTEMRKESIIVMYINQQHARKGSFKTILKAILADGSKKSTTTFPEIFEKEPRGRKKESKKRKREKLDLNNNKFGGYFDDDGLSSGASESPTPQKPRNPRGAPSFGTSHPEIVESIDLRLRLFKLISLVTYALGKTTELHELYEEFGLALKQLPLPIFSLIASQRANSLLPEIHVTLTKELFHLLLPSSHKSPNKIDPAGEANGALTQKMLEECFAIHPANTVDLEDNAKLSLVVENAMQLLWLSNTVQYTDGFAAAIEQGIEARNGRAKKKRTGKAKAADPSDVLAQDVLEGSAERIRLLLELLRATTS